ncbi:SpoIID/LytB domain-containing protein [Jatrophihabitans sp.]|uniref:SpoIID/LytB domain-containing protein n=1 Tax=Jatrophihabitans sp. TaxID=1932789 RepID=UPI002C8B687F|nr:SpoIID/LytB domain-containing protein [Jatrophihabitans sp.]
MFSIRPQRRTAGDHPSQPGRSRRALAAVLGGTLACTALAGVFPAPAGASWPNGQVEISGHGFGHGRGMGQYGAFGYATLYGWSYTQILSHFYGGTTLATRSLGTLSVDLTDFDGVNQVAVTSGSPFNAGGVAIPAGGAALLRYVSAGSYQLATSAGCGTPWSAVKPVTSGAISATVPATSLSSMLTICSGSTKRTYRGSLLLTSGGGLTRLVNLVGMEDYLRGVVPRESPASWGDASGGKGMAALQSQAVAARSYAAAQNRYSWAKTCDNQNCQVYGGAGLNGVVTEDSRTNTAVSSTAGKVLTNSSGGIVSAEFSSSTGGWTAGGTFPAVEDLGDAASPNHDWTTTIPATTIGNAFGVGVLQAISTTGNGLGADGGRVLTATVKGSTGTVTVTGNQFRSTLGLMSDWFKVAKPLATPTMYVTDSLTNPVTTTARAFGAPGDQPFACDFDGNGTDSAGVYRSATATFYYRDSFAADAPLHAVRLGVPGDRPVCGDWDGNGTDTVGVYRPSNSMFYLLNTNIRTASSPLTQVLLGGAGALPVAGDWNGDKRATPGVYDPKTATFYLVNTLAPGSPRLSYRFGLPGDVPIAGDWDGDGTDSYGIYRSPWFAVASTLGGPATYAKYGLAGDRPMAGDWNGDHKDTVGVGRDY